jgi:parallel beta-helix repeat protein
VRNVTLRGLTFSHTDWDPGTNGYADTQAAVAIRGDVRAEYAVNCAIKECTFTQLAGYALELGRGCQGFRVVGNEMADVGAGGVRIGETTKRSDVTDMNHSHVVTDNHMHHLGLVYPPAVGVFIMQSGTNRVAHNHIHHLYYTAVSVGWNWGYQETPCRENIIEFNHLHDVGQGMLSDMGAVYTLGIQKGTVIRNNLIHDVNSFTYGGWGLYTDEGSSEIVLENNVVYRTKSAGFHQHYGRDNIVRNNIFAFGKEYQLMRTREEDHISFIFTNNIVYFDSGALLGSNWKNEKFVMNGNVFFDARPDASVKFAEASFDEWKARGHDTNSMIADPQFRDAGKFDFALKAQSPALNHGFKPIDVSKAGVRKKK